MVSHILDYRLKSENFPVFDELSEASWPRPVRSRLLPPPTSLWYCKEIFKREESREFARQFRRLVCQPSWESNCESIETALTGTVAPIFSGGRFRGAVLCCDVCRLGKSYGRISLRATPIPVNVERELFRGTLNGSEHLVRMSASCQKQTSDPLMRWIS